MPQYTVSDPTSGKTLTLTGDSPPTEGELNQIFSQVGGAKPPALLSLATLKDVGQSALTGLAQGATSAESMAEHVSNPLQMVKDVAHYGAEGINRLAGTSLPVVNNATTGERVDSALQNGDLGSLLRNGPSLSSLVTGPSPSYYHTPQTIPGEYARTIGQFAPNALGGPEGFVPKLLSVIAPALGSETAGQLTKGTSLEPVARILGAVGGGGALGLAERGTSALRASGESVPSTGLAPTSQQLRNAAQYVKGGLDTAGMTPADLEAAQNAVNGKPITAAEAMGPRGQLMLKALGARAGQTGEALAGDLTARNAGTSQRILSDFAQASGIDPAAAQGDLQKFVQKAQQAASPLYEQAYSANQNIASPAIDRVLSTPAGRKALNTAAQLMQNDMSRVGVPDPDLLEQARESGQEIPWKGGVASGLKLRSLDLVKRALDDQISAAFRSGQKTEGGVLVGLKNKFVNALDEADVTAAAGPNSLKPEGGLYAQARAASGDYLRAQEQFENGRNFILNPNVSVADMQLHLAGLGPADAQAFKGGIANRLFSAAQNARMSPRIFDAPSIQQKLAAAIGQDQAAQFLKNVSIEKTLAGNARYMMPRGGSPTMPMSEEFSAQDAENPSISNAISFGANIARNPRGALLSKAIELAGNKAAQIHAQYYSPGLSTEARNAAGHLLMMPPADLAKLMGGNSGAFANLPAQIPSLGKSIVPRLVMPLLLAAPSAAQASQ